MLPLQALGLHTVLSPYIDNTKYCAYVRLLITAIMSLFKILCILKLGGFEILVTERFIYQYLSYNCNDAENVILCCQELIRWYIFVLCGCIMLYMPCSQHPPAGRTMGVISRGCIQHRHSVLAPA